MREPNGEGLDLPLLLGVDAGGTRCRARVADASGRILGEGQGPAANVLTDPAGSWSSIEQAMSVALRTAGLATSSRADMVSVLGLAGLDPARPEAPADWPLSAFRACLVETDAYIAQQGAFGGGDGAILIVGTGAVGLLVRGGERVSIGGYGAAVSDEGSGAWIGREAVRRALWAFDGRLPRSRVAARILAEVGEPPAAQAWANSARPADYAALTSVVFSAADEGDRQAADILDEAAGHLDQILICLADAGAREVCLMGGLAKALRPRLETKAPETKALEIIEPHGAALDGALLLARSLARTCVAPRAAG
ncbi:MAG TPA: BadF/BadG/BcrA/BcrD ATPase family protein [Caulobacteraceae bacterium]|jgi:glucosamine kinase|nr:BadF/BadG/BcrA/BcrD ATPase family protein [Caulobacteraceae bacterium]